LPGLLLLGPLGLFGLFLGDLLGALDLRKLVEKCRTLLARAIKQQIKTAGCGVS